MNNKDNEFDFYKDYKPKNPDRFEDVYSASKPRQVEDIYSVSKGGKHFAKTKRGFGYKFRRWWMAREGWQKAMMITATSMLVIVGLLVGTVRILFNYNYNDITDDPEDLGFEATIDKDIINIALFGLDTRNKDSFKGNSDSIMILSLNCETKQVKIISVLRDSLVPITYNGKTTYNKINSAYSKGGPELAIKTLNTIFNLDISDYATVNFYGMSDIIDAVGGIDAELTDAEVGKYDGTQHTLNGCIAEVCANLGYDPNKYYIFNSGVQHLNGIQAVAYSRIRYVANIWGTSNDYGRTDRQRYVMEQLFNKAITLGKSQYIKLAKALIPCSETSLSYTEIISLACNILLRSPTFKQDRIPQQEWLMGQPNAGVGSVVYYDLDFASKLIHSFIYDDITFEDYIAANGVQKNDWFAKRGVSAGSGSKTGTSSSSGITSDTSSQDTASDDSSKLESDDDKDNTSKNTSSDTSSNDTSSEDTSSKDKDTSSKETASGDTSSDDNSSSETAASGETTTEE